MKKMVNRAFMVDITHHCFEVSSFIHFNVSRDELETPKHLNQSMMNEYIENRSKFIEMMIVMC